jgi:putative addiction module component (TIGR02574 family)
MSSAVLDEILKLSVEDRIRIAQEIWDSVAADETAVPVTQAQKDELDRRLEDMTRNPGAGRSWEEFRSELERKG